MYCQTCEADVAAEVSTDGKSLLCTTCGNEVRKSHTQSQSDDAKSARDLLERWKLDDDADPFAATPPVQSSNSPTAPPPTTPAPVHGTANDPAARGGQHPSDHDAESAKPQQPAHSAPPTDEIRRVDAAGSLSGPKFRPRRGSSPGAGRDAVAAGHSDQPPLDDRPRRGDRPTMSSDDQQQAKRPQRKSAGQGTKKFRIDAAHVRPVDDGVETGGPTIPPPHRRPAPAMPDGHRLDAAQGIPAPHMRTESFIPPNGKKPGRVESVAGQLLAYGGVGMLTIGTALILWGYFGGPVKYAPTGWLVATVGQMLLFLGVVTLISGGMQQTTHEVGIRVADLGNRLGRIEETTELALSAPHFMKDRNRSRASAMSELEDGAQEDWRRQDD